MVHFLSYNSLGNVVGIATRNGLNRQRFDSRQEQESSLQNPLRPTLGTQLAFYLLNIWALFFL